MNKRTTATLNSTRRTVPLLRAALLTTGALLAGCAVGPDFKTPAAPTATQYGAQAPAATTSTPVVGGEAQQFLAGQAVPDRWWTMYESDKLNTLVERALTGSPTITAAQATLQQAQQNLVATRSGLFPAVDGSLSADRQKALSSTAPGGTAIYNLFNASVNVSYALDVFGGVRRATEAQRAQVDNQAEVLAATYQTLAANVVTAAVQEASLRAQIAATQDILSSQQNQLKVVERQQQLGGAAYSDVLTARSNLAATQATLPPLQQQLDQTQNQLAVYEGKLPSDRAATDFDLAELKLPTAIPVSLPSELVRRRPDIREAEAQLHQASAQVGVATANRLPQIALTASYGTQAARTGDLFDQNIWSLGASLTQPIFHAGELTARQRAAEAAYTAAGANYQQTVLTAFQNVADSLRALDKDAQVLQAQHDADQAATESLRLTEAQYRLGATSYLNLLTAQRQAQQTRIAYVQALASRQADTAALFLALGGGALPATTTASSQ